MPSLLQLVILKGLKKLEDEEKTWWYLSLRKWMNMMTSIQLMQNCTSCLSEKYEKLYRLATKKMSDVKLNQRELSTKVDEANQTIGVLRFDNNFLAEKTKKLEAELL